jgi:hypothetical protein
MVVPVVGTLVIIGVYWLVSRLRPRVLAAIPGPSFAAQGAYATAAALVLVTFMVLGASTIAFIYFQF